MSLFTFTVWTAVVGAVAAIVALRKLDQLAAQVRILARELEQERRERLAGVRPGEYLDRDGLIYAEGADSYPPVGRRPGRGYMDEPLGG